jgi:bifunctional UDP-N-acetylglucosamine pyrophosphorylase/glucosamine-1-phosphate N-acetyltransferase
MPLHAVILAAGKGTRMKSQVPKVLHRIAGLSLIEHVLRTAAALQPASITIVVGHGAGEVEKGTVPFFQALKGKGDCPLFHFVVQEQQLGTGHALLQAAPVLRGKEGTVVLLSGDVPLLTPASLNGLLATHRDAGAACTVMTARMPKPFGYGRIVRSGGHITKIVEERDASQAQKALTEINSGIYAFDLPPLFDSLESIGKANAQGEYYLPDLVAIYRKQKREVATWTVERSDEIRGINSRAELAEVSAMVRHRKNEELMAAGVTLVDPATTYVDADVVVGADTVIHPCVFLEGSTRVGSACEIHSGARLVNATLGDRVTVRNHTVITDTVVKVGAVLGPFAHLRPGSEVGEDAHVGNFVELKKTVMGKGAKANHLAYLGDSAIGARANIGAGTITCNYDGEKKHQTTIGDGAFVGSDTTLVAPVTVGDGAYIAAGSAITRNVPPGALGIARAKQENKEGWVTSRKGKGEK